MMRTLDYRRACHPYSTHVVQAQKTILVTAQSCSWVVRAALTSEVCLARAHSLVSAPPARPRSGFHAPHMLFAPIHVLACTQTHACGYAGFSGISRLHRARERTRPPSSPPHGRCAYLAPSRAPRPSRPGKYVPNVPIPSVGVHAAEFGHPRGTRLGCMDSHVVQDGRFIGAVVIVRLEREGRVERIGAIGREE